jgi:hypothetical protein
VRSHDVCVLLCVAYQFLTRTEADPRHSQISSISGKDKEARTNSPPTELLVPTTEAAPNGGCPSSLSIPLNLCRSLDLTTIPYHEALPGDLLPPGSCCGRILSQRNQGASADRRIDGTPPRRLPDKIDRGYPVQNVFRHTRVMGITRPLGGRKSLGYCALTFCLSTITQPLLACLLACLLVIRHRSPKMPCTMTTPRPCRIPMSRPPTFPTPLIGAT